LFTTRRILRGVPKLWDDTIDAHRRAVREAALDTTAALVAERGLRSVTMSAIAERTGIGRATLYKYFADVETILAAWHERQVRTHLHQLIALSERGGSATERLEVVLGAYAAAARDHQDGELSALLHREPHVTRAQHHVRDFLRDLIAEGSAEGGVRGDVAPEELAAYCLHALAAAGDLPSRAAVGRLVAVTLDGLRKPA
jgi:AcrR family transcriptional regulator